MKTETDVVSTQTRRRIFVKSHTKRKTTMDENVRSIKDEEESEYYEGGRGDEDDNEIEEPYEEISDKTFLIDGDDEKKTARIAIRKKEAFFTMDQERLMLIVFNVFFFDIVLPLIYWVTIIYKICSDGLGDYFNHFTNWNFTLQGCFFFAEFLSKLAMILNGKKIYKFEKAEQNEFAFFAIGFFYWIALGSAVLVCILTVIMLGDNPDIIIELTSKYDLGFILGMDRFFHVFPLLAIGAYTFFQEKLIGKIMKTLVFRGAFDFNKPNRAFFSWAYLLIVIIFNPLFMLALYFACLDINVVYGITTPDWILLLFSLALVFISNGIVFIVIRYRHI